MKPIIRYRSQLLYRRSYKPARIIKIRVPNVKLISHPVRCFGAKPELAIVS